MPKPRRGFGPGGHSVAGAGPATEIPLVWTDDCQLCFYIASEILLSQIINRAPRQGEPVRNVGCRVRPVNQQTSTESLILAQDERWRRA